MTESFILILALALASTALLLSLTTCVFSILAYTETIGIKKSTHKIEWVPIPEDERGPVGVDLKKNMDEALEQETDNDIY